MCNLNYDQLNNYNYDMDPHDQRRLDEARESGDYGNLNSDETRYVQYGGSNLMSVWDD